MMILCQIGHFLKETLYSFLVVVSLVFSPTLATPVLALS